MTQDPQMFCLRWNNHQTNLQSVFDQLLQMEAFCDVTIAVEFGTIKCHKMILAASSPYFQSIFMENTCQHPIVFLPKDIKYKHMKALLDYMYHGEVSVEGEELSVLLKVAEALKIKGLVEVDEEGGPLAKTVYPGPMPPNGALLPMYGRPGFPPSRHSSTASDQGGAARAGSVGRNGGLFGSMGGGQSSPELAAGRVGSQSAAAKHNNSSQQPSSQPSSPSSASQQQSRIWAISPTKLLAPNSRMLDERDSSNQMNPTDDNVLVIDEESYNCNAMTPIECEFPENTSPMDSKPPAPGMVRSVGANGKLEWKRYKQYTKDDILAAIEEVKGGISALQASRKYGVPSRTLYDKVKKMGILTPNMQKHFQQKKPSGNASGSTDDRKFKGDQSFGGNDSTNQDTASESSNQEAPTGPTGKILPQINLLGMQLPQASLPKVEIEPRDRALLSNKPLGEGSSGDGASKPSIPAIPAAVMLSMIDRIRSGNKLHVEEGGAPLNLSSFLSGSVQPPDRADAASERTHDDQEENRTGRTSAGSDSGHSSSDADASVQVKGEKSQATDFRTQFFAQLKRNQDLTGATLAGLANGEHHSEEPIDARRTIDAMSHENAEDKATEEDGTKTTSPSAGANRSASVIVASALSHAVTLVPRSSSQKRRLDEEATGSTEEEPNKVQRLKSEEDNDEDNAQATSDQRMASDDVDPDPEDLSTGGKSSQC